jgi:N-acetyl-alpha-D-muramate 1-phosphate uridylyltransferase
MKAMILAAGRGARMGALCDKQPKPLLPIAGKPLIAHTLIALANAGINDVVINVSYLGHLIQKALGDGKQYGVTITYSVESPALETGGGIYKALPLLGNDPFIVVSGDLWTDYPWQQLATRLTGLAHLVMVDNPVFHPQGDFYLDQNNILQQTGGPKLTYASMGIFHPQLFKDCQAGTFRLTEVLLPAISRGEITGEHFKGDWINIGTPEQWKELTKRF